jgi:PAS domain S-box-containing protein
MKSKIKNNYEDLENVLKKYKNLFEQAPDFYHSINKDGVILECNQTWTKVLGYKKEEVIGKTIFDFQTEASKEIGIKHLTEFRSKGKLKNVELQLVKKNGEIIDVLLNALAVYDENGVMVGSMSIMRDITQRKILEREIQKAKEFNEFIVQNIGESILIEDENGYYTFVNPRFEQLSGYKKDELLKMKWTDLVSKEFLNKVREETKKRPKNIKSIYEAELLTKDGKKIPILINATPIFDNKKFKGILVAFTDITELKKLEEKLRESEEKFRNLFENSIDAIVVIKKGVIVMANNAFLKMFGYDNIDGIIGRNYLFFADVESRDFLEQMRLKRDRGEKFPSRFEFKAIRKDGSVFDVEVSVGIILFKEEILRIVIVRDLTERKLIQEQLVYSEKLSSIGTMVAGVAHEINNPLSIIMSSAELLKEEVKLNPEIQSYIDMIIEGTNRCARIVENLVTFARKKEFCKELININKIINETLILRECHLSLNNIKVKRNFQEDIGMVFADPHQLKRVFLNLIDNSTDAMIEANKGDTIEIKTYQENDKILIEFIDDGPGIQKEKRSKIFDPFFTTKDVGKGTGLGLSVVYGIIKEHDGEICYDIFHKDGCKFVIKLPLSEKDEKSDDSLKLDEQKEKTKKILVVDDEESILGLSKRILEKEGYNVNTAFNVAKAFTLIQNIDFNVIIADIKMLDELGGKELFELIKDTKPNLCDRFIVMTGDTAELETKQFIEKNNLNFIKKPFKILRFLDIIKNIP